MIPYEKAIVTVGRKNSLNNRKRHPAAPGLALCSNKLEGKRKKKRKKEEHRDTRTKQKLWEIIKSC